MYAPKWLFAWFMVLLVVPTVEAAPLKVLKVFILAGQSNMEGKAKMSLLEKQIHAPQTKALFAPLHENGTWIERSDVWIKFLNRKGKLTTGYGSRNCIGPELGFGWTMGDRLNEQVLIIKTAWGGKSLYKDFRPPSAGKPDAALLAQDLSRQKKRHPAMTEAELLTAYGKYYRLMIEDVRETLMNLNSHFPEYQGQGYEIAGFVWFQGWNDMVNRDYTRAYGKNMAHFIRDVRKDLKQPQLPFVIGQMGVGGTQDTRKQVFKSAQAEPASLPEFKGNVFVVNTDQYWDMTADAVFKKGWRENLEEWNRVGSDRPYHYLGSAKCYWQMGVAFAEVLLK